jgi:streptogramin lyase
MKRIIPVLLCLFVLFVLPAPARAALPVNEAGLNPQGSAYEINPDSDGWLWISDYWGGEVWRVNPQTGAYYKYMTDPNPSDELYSFPADARRSGNFFWWVEGDSDLIGRAAVASGAFTLWKVPVASLYGSALDASGRLWASDGSQPYIYRLEDKPADTPDELCTFALPDGGQTYYFAYQDPYLWLGDYVNSRLLRLHVNDFSYSWWQLPEQGDPPIPSSPFGMTVDADGHLWYADDSIKELAELDPDSDVLTHYVIPTKSMPQMVAVVGDEVWYTGHSPNTIGVLDSLAAAKTTSNLTQVDSILSPDCSAIPTYTSGNLTMVTGTISWTPTSYPPLVDANGWQIYQMPVDASPWGIAYRNGEVWVVDSGRQKLVEIDATGRTDTFNVFLPLIIR